MGAQKMRSRLIEVSGFISCLRDSGSFSVHIASLQEMYSVRCCTNICVCGCMFLTFIILHLWVRTAGSLEEMYGVGCCSSICLCGNVFPTLVILHLSVHTSANVMCAGEVGP